MELDELLLLEIRFDISFVQGIRIRVGSMLDYLLLKIPARFILICRATKMVEHQMSMSGWKSACPALISFY